MKPKKKSYLSYVIYAVSLLIVLYFAVHCAIVYETVEAMYLLGQIEKQQQFFLLMGGLAERLEATPFAFSYNQYTLRLLLYGFLGWLLVVAALIVNKKNYIHGIEFGTARWGREADIKDLFASSVEAEEIKDAKRLRTPLGRHRVRKKLYEQSEKNGEILLKARLNELEASERVNKANGKGDRRKYRQRREEIKSEVKEFVACLKQQAWPPARAKADYASRLKEISESQFRNADEREREKRAAKATYIESIRDFRNYDKRLAKIKTKYKDADMLFTKTERISFYNWVLNNNTLIIGGSGSGKTRGYVMPNILQAHSSYIVTDPKGEILEKAGYFLSEIQGYKIRVLNLKEKHESDGYNPFVYIHPDRDGYEERVLSLIETIIVNTVSEEKKSSNDPFWDNAERLFLQSIFFFTCDGFVKEERNMNTVLKLIRMLKIAEEEDDMNSDLDVFANIFAARFGEEHIGVQQFREFREKASGKTAKSIVISSVARLAPFKTPAVQRIFSYDSVHLDLVGEEKTAVFVVVPPTDSTFNFIAGMLFTQLFQELEYCATVKYKHKGQRLPVPCRFILDEYANTCKIPRFTQILAYARSFGIGITPILQSLEQIKSMHKDEWGVIIDNCNTLLCLGSITHMDTLEYMSKLLGKGTFDKRTTGKTSGTNGNSSRNEDVIGRELMTPDEIRKMPKKDCILVVGGREPFYSEKYDYTSHPNYRFTSDANKEYSFHYTPPDPSAEKQETDEEEKEPTPSDNAKVEVVPVIVDASATNQLARVTKNAASMQPIPDEELTVEDGDNTTEETQRKILQEFIAEEDAAKEIAQLSVSEETTAYLNNLRNNRIRVEEGLIQTVNRLGRVFRFLEIIPNEELTVDDGEESTVVDGEMLSYILEDDNQASEEELADIFADVTSMLAGFDEPTESEESTNSESTNSYSPVSLGGLI